MVLNSTENGKRKQKWISTGLPVKGNKRKAEQRLRVLAVDRVTAESTEEYPSHAKPLGAKISGTASTDVRRGLKLSKGKPLRDREVLPCPTT